MLLYHEFSPEKLRCKPQTHSFKLPDRPEPLTVYSLAFASQNQQATHPIFILSGAFQSFTSFQVEVATLTRTHPVIIVEMPSQGSNTQAITRFSLDDYAHLLHEFVLSSGLKKINIIGLSYGSAMALLYAALYPTYCERLVLSGITCFKRPDIMPLLQDSLDLLARKDMHAYASLALCNLINHSHLAKTGISKGYRRLLYRQIKSLTPEQCAIHIENTQRLMQFSGFKHYPSCPTLVVAGEFDSFTQADEQAVTATNCVDARFAIIHNADHLVQLEQVEPMAQLGYAFFNQNSLENIAGISLFEPNQYEFNKGSISPLKCNLSLKSTLIASSGETQDVIIRQINISEFQIQLQAKFNHDTHKLKLKIHHIDEVYRIHLLKKNQNMIEGVFSHQDMNATNKLLKLIDSIG